MNLTHKVRVNIIVTLYKLNRLGIFRNSHTKNSRVLLLSTGNLVAIAEAILELRNDRQKKIWQIIRLMLTKEKSCWPGFVNLSKQLQPLVMQNLNSHKLDSEISHAIGLKMVGSVRIDPYFNDMIMKKILVISEILIQDDSEKLI